jgi:hypothetical protein
MKPASRAALPWLLALALAGGGATAAAAQADPAVWRVTVTPYVWTAGLAGDVTDGGVTVSPDATFLDILEESDALLGFQGHLGVSRGRVTAFVDVFYLKLQVDDLGPTRIDLTNRMRLVEFGLEYRLLDTTEASGRGVTLDALAGGRYSYLELDLDTPGVPSANRSTDWIDPIAGGRATFHVTPQLFLVVQGDVGGFGVGSDFAWSATGLLGYRWQGWGLEWALLAGYKALGQDYESGSGQRRFRWDATLHGPVLGLSVRF